MAEVHQLIAQHGIEEARNLATTKHERALVEAAYQVLSDDAEKLGFTYSGFALTSLPHKPQSELLWRKEGHNLTMLIESGRDITGKPLGLPYGSYARFILLFLQSEAIRTSSREVELGRSMRVWLGGMGLSIGGTTYKLVHGISGSLGDKLRELNPILSGWANYYRYCVGAGSRRDGFPAAA